MKLILDYAKKQKLVRENVVIGTLLPQLKKANISYLTKERQEVWLDCMEEDARPFALLFATLLQTGMRPEEGCGLKWKCVDFNNDLIIVENAYKQRIIYDDNFKPIKKVKEDGELKTLESYRSIPMQPRLRKMLSSLYYKQRNKFKRNKKVLTGYDYVFLNETNSPYTPEDLTNKMPKFRKMYNLEHCTVYGLRHSFATLCSEKEITDIVLKELMGHSDTSTTKKYYIHISMDRKKNELQKIWQ